MDVQNEQMKTAVAMARANVRGDAEAMRNLWNSTNPDDADVLIGAMAALPTLVLCSVGIGAGVVYDVDEYYRQMLGQLSRADE